jgi:uncharacterized protein
LPVPLFCIHCHDHPGKDAVRAQHYPAHRAFLATSSTHGVKIAASGPLVSDDGTRAIGSLFIVEAESAAAARSFNAADPFAQANLWASAMVTRFDIKRGSFGSTPTP